MDAPVPYLNFERGKQRCKSEILAKHSVSQLSFFKMFGEIFDVKTEEVLSSV